MNRNILRIGALVLFAIIISPAQAQTELPPLDGRLGGTLTSWIAEYGEPLPSDFPIELSTEFDIEGFSGVLVSFREELATRAHLFAPRAEGEEWESGDEPHPMNWTREEANAIVLDFLPRDVFLVGTVEERSGSLTQNCESPALLAQVPTTTYDYVDDNPVYGGCSYWLNLDDAGNVTAILVELQIEEPLG